MSEPRLEDIEDYNTLKGVKKKIVYSVIAIGIFIGVIYTFVYDKNKSVEDSIPVEKSVNNIPIK